MPLCCVPSVSEVEEGSMVVDGSEYLRGDDDRASETDVVVGLALQHVKRSSVQQPTTNSTTAYRRIKPFQPPFQIQHQKIWLFINTLFGCTLINQSSF